METNSALKSDSFISVEPTRGLQVSKDIIARKNQDGTVIIMKADESSVFYKIDGIAAQVWSCLSQRTTLEELALAIKEKHPKNNLELDVDIPKFVLELLNKSLLIYC